MQYRIIHCALCITYYALKRALRIAHTPCKVAKFFCLSDVPCILSPIYFLRLLFLYLIVYLIVLLILLFFLVYSAFDRDLTESKFTFLQGRLLKFI